MATDESIIVVLGPLGGGTSAVASVLHHLGVYMGTNFDASYRELHQTWEDGDVSLLIRRAISMPGLQFQADPAKFQQHLRLWADRHRLAAGAMQQRPGVKHPLLCMAVDLLQGAWGPFTPVVVDRPLPKVLTTLNRLGWWHNEAERKEATTRLLASRDASLADSPTVRVDFEELRASPDVSIRRLAEELGLEVTEDQVKAAADSIVGAANLPNDVDPFQRFIDQLAPEIQDNPNDPRPVILLAQVYFDSGDFANARRWFARRVELGGELEEETFLAMFRVAQSMEELGMPWHEVQNAYLTAWEFRPTRAEPLYCIACQYFNNKRYRLGHLFAAQAAQIPRPDDDMVLPYPEIYLWRATDLQARSALCIGNYPEAFALWRSLLQSADITTGERQLIASSRDEAVPGMLEAVSFYPDALVRGLIEMRRSDDVTLSLIAGPDLIATQQTLNSFLNCCKDIAHVGRFVIVDAGLSDADREILTALYGFLEFIDEPGAELASIRSHIRSRFWFHLGQNWRFFAPDDLITRLSSVLVAEPQVFQVAINVADASALTGVSAPEDMVGRAIGTGRYVLLDGIASGPAMFDTARLDQADGLQTASLDEVFCIAVT